MLFALNKETEIKRPGDVLFIIFPRGKQAVSSRQVAAVAYCF